MNVEYVTAEAASKLLDFSAEILAYLRTQDAIAGQGALLDLADATGVVAEIRAAVAPVAGQAILVSEAVKKYGFSNVSIYKWIEDGWVRVLIPEPKKMIDEGDMRLAKILAERRGHVTGRAVFPPKPRSGRPKKRKES